MHCAPIAMSTRSARRWPARIRSQALSTAGHHPRSRLSPRRWCLGDEDAVRNHRCLRAAIACPCDDDGEETRIGSMEMTQLAEPAKLVCVSTQFAGREYTLSRRRDRHRSGGRKRHRHRPPLGVAAACQDRDDPADAIKLSTCKVPMAPSLTESLMRKRNSNAAT